MTNANDNFSTRQFIYTVPQQVLFDPTLSLIDLKVYMLIRGYVDDKLREYPSLEWIAKRLKQSESVIAASMSHLLTTPYLQQFMEVSK